MLNRGRIAWVLDAGRQPFSDAQAALDLRQKQKERRRPSSPDRHQTPAEPACRRLLETQAEFRYA